MTQVAVELPLFSDPSYQYNISLENRSRQLIFNWNDRTESWYMDVLNDDGTVVMLGVKLVPQYPIAVDYKLDAYGMTGYFILMQKNVNQLGVKYNLITDIPERYSFYYVFEEAS